MPTIYEVVRELNQQSLDDLYGRYGENGALSGKFVRIGRVIVVAPTIKCDSIPGQESSLPQHEAIAGAAFQSIDPELSEKLAKAEDELHDAKNEPVIDYQFSIVDAGHYMYIAMSELLIHGNSFHFGGANEQGRARTIEIARSNVDNSIDVHD